MRAMVLVEQNQALQLQEIDKPVAKPGQLLIRVASCGICRTDLHVLDGDLKEPKLPLVPGHQIVGYVDAIEPGPGAHCATENFQLGQRVGVPWLGSSCGKCDYCRNGEENLCDYAQYTGYQIDGGFAEYTVADARYCFPLPEGFTDLQVAPLLCAGLIGYRSYRGVMDANIIGLYGFGAAAHILIQVAKYRGQKVYAFTREGDVEAQQFARSLGADWTGDSTETPPSHMDAAIIFAPVGELVTYALQHCRKGGQVVCAGIHMSDIPSFPYEWLWGERSIRSIANLTRTDGEEFLPLAAKIPVHTDVHEYPLEEVNQALDDLRYGRFTGAAVIVL